MTDMTDPDAWIPIRKAAALIPVHRSAMLRAVQRAERKGLIATIKNHGQTGIRLVRPIDIPKIYPALQRHAAGRRALTATERSRAGIPEPFPAKGTEERAKLLRETHTR